MVVLTHGQFCVEVYDNSITIRRERLSTPEERAGNPDADCMIEQVNVTFGDRTPEVEITNELCETEY